MKEKIKIILADDNQHFIDGLKLILKRCPACYVLAEYSSGKELSQSKHLPYADLIITDIEMPEMNGIEAAKEISLRYPDLPMMAITMHADKIYMTEIMQAGFKGFVHKPDVARQLLHIIKKVLENKFVFPINMKINK